MDLDGTRAWVLAEDEKAIVRDTEIHGVRLLANRDPLNAARDRDVLVKDPELRKRIWTAIGGPGTVLVAGEVAGLWRSAKKGRKLVVTVEPLGKLTAAAKDELRDGDRAHRPLPRSRDRRAADRGALRLAQRPSAQASGLSRSTGISRPSVQRG